MKLSIGVCVVGLCLLALAGGCKTAGKYTAVERATPITVQKIFAFETPSVDALGNPLTGAGSILGYNVYAKTNPNFVHGYNIVLSFQGARPSTNSYTETFSIGLKSGSLWYVSITVTNVYGESVFSDIVPIPLLKPAKGGGLRVLN